VITANDFNLRCNFYCRQIAVYWLPWCRWCHGCLADVSTEYRRYNWQQFGYIPVLCL